MLDIITYPLSLPNYSQVAKFEGRGNWAIKKYYQIPYRFFYRHKLRMIVRMIEREYINVLDFGSGPGIFTKELKKHSLFVKNYELGDIFDDRWKFDLIVCASVFEFLSKSTLPGILENLKSILRYKGNIIIASPMDTKLSRWYFKMIGDTKERLSHTEILKAIASKFETVKYREWFGLYFCIKVTK